MTLSEVKQMISHLRSTPICELEVSELGFSLKIKMNCAPVAMTRAEPKRGTPQTGFQAVHPPSIARRIPQVAAVGQFRASHPSRPGRLAHLGKQVMSGEVVGLLKIGPLYRAVYATQRGTIVRSLWKQGKRSSTGKRCSNCRRGKCNP